jgi:TonB family protein
MDQEAVVLNGRFCALLIALTCLPTRGWDSFVPRNIQIGAEGSLANAVQRLQFASLAPEIKFDTRGVEFRPWLVRFIAQVKRNWLLPYGAMSLNGHVAITFNVHKDGSVTDATVTSPSPIEDFNRAALGAVTVSNTTPPLPVEFPDEKAFFTVTFFYNEPPPGGSLPPRPAAVSWPPPGIYVAGAEGVTPPRVLHEEKAPYTPDAMREKIEGSVLLEGIVQPNGSIAYLHVIRSLDPTFGLDREALKAAMQWRFAPGMRMGEAVPVVATVEIAFSLKK